VARTSEQIRIPKSLQDLGRKAYPDVDRWTDVLSTVESYLDYLSEADRANDAEIYLKDCEAQFKWIIAENRKQQLRTSFRVIATGIATAIFVSIARSW